MASPILQKVYIFFASFILTLFVMVMAKKMGFFQIPKKQFEPPPKLTLSDVLGVFALFLFIELFIVPGVVYLWFAYQAGALIPSFQIHIDPITQGWLNLVAVGFSAIGIFFYCINMHLHLRKLIFWGTHHARSFSRALNQIYFGGLVWFLSYPTVVCVGQLVGIAVLYFIPSPPLDQIAVKNLKGTFQSPQLFWTTVVVIIFLVPIAEEILFRGFLQRWLVQHLGTWKGIAIAAALFAFFHFSTTQGIDNIELLISLFVLACFLGFIYERQGTLWAPIGLHMTFNAISVCMIFLQELTKKGNA